MYTGDFFCTVMYSHPGEISKNPMGTSHGENTGSFLVRKLPTSGIRSLGMGQKASMGPALRYKPRFHFRNLKKNSKLSNLERHADEANLEASLSLVFPALHTICTCSRKHEMFPGMYTHILYAVGNLNLPYTCIELLSSLKNVLVKGKYIPLKLFPIKQLLN